MRVRVLPGTVLEDATQSYPPGVTLDLQDAEARRLLAAGKVEVVEEEKKKGGKKTEGGKADPPPPGPPAGGGDPAAPNQSDADNPSEDETA